jgi:predicted dehydrogenase
MKRRDFVKAASMGAAGVAASALKFKAVAGASARRPVAPSDQISLGVIGTGSRGKYMMRQMLRVPGVRIGALCDVYEPRFTEGREITGERTPTYTDYRRMLDAESGLDAVLVATPLSFHKEHMVASLDRGLHVYGEKAMGFTVDDCGAIVAAARRHGRWFQVGLQYRYAPWYRQAIKRIAEGEIGRVTHIYAYWHRNYNWRRPVPKPSLERLINWRLYREFSGGLLAELGSHHIDVANWILGETPKRVIGDGGIDYYDDGRETYDNVQAVYTYPSGAKLLFSSIIGNHKLGFQILVFGTGGTVELTLQDGAFFYEPARANSAVPEEMMERGVNTTASLSTEGDMPYRGPGRKIEIPEEEAGDPNYLASAAFIDCLRQNKRPFADEQVGWASAVPVALGNEAIYSTSRVDFGVKPTTNDNHSDSRWRGGDEP